MVSESIYESGQIPTATESELKFWGNCTRWSRLEVGGTRRGVVGFVIVCRFFIIFIIVVVISNFDNQAKRGMENKLPTDDQPQYTHVQEEGTDS